MYTCTRVVVEWDPAKARQNVRKHGVSFADVVTALEDERALTERDVSLEEERWVTMGMDGVGRVLVVVYTWRGENPRLISARNATRRERRVYEESNEARPAKSAGTLRAPAPPQEGCRPLVHPLRARYAGLGTLRDNRDVTTNASSAEIGRRRRIVYTKYLTLPAFMKMR